MRPEALVTAPTRQLYEHWLKLNPLKNPNLYPFIGDERKMRGWIGPIIVINGGSHDPHIRSRIKHPAIAGLLTYLEV